MHSQNYNLPGNAWYVTVMVFVCLFDLNILLFLISYTFLFCSTGMVFVELLLEWFYEDIEKNVDTTTDVAQKHQTSIVVRYVTPENTISERAVGFRESTDGSGEAIFKTVKKSLEDIGLETRKIYWDAHLMAHKTCNREIRVSSYIVHC